jgi:hypothetical protein
MSLRSNNLSHRKQLAEYQFLAQAAVERHAEKLQAAVADLDSGDPLKRLDARLTVMSEPNVPDPPDRDIGSWQSVQIFRPITKGDGLHPEARQFFWDEELADVEDPAWLAPVLNRIGYRHFDYVEDSEHEALVGFQTEGQEKADIAHQKKLADRAAKNQRRAERASYKVAQDLVEPVDEAEAKKARAEREKWAGFRREHAAEVHDRLKYGFYFPGGKIAGGFVEKFSEFFGAGILRSSLGSPSLGRMAALYPKVGELRAGYDKGALFTSTCKLFALDAPYVELNRKVAGCIVVELDSVLRIKEFRLKLLEILGPHRMPNLIVGRTTRDGHLSRPHLIWILKKPVWWEPYRESTDLFTGEVKSYGDKRCKTKPINKFLAVQRGLTQLLLPLGADPACHNIWKPKCPLSPFWTTIIANDDCWHELGDFDEIKGWPRNIDEHAMEQTAATMRAEAKGATLTASNLAWNTIGHVIEPLARLQLSVREPDFIDAGKRSVATLAAWFEAKVRPVVENELGPSVGLDKILERRCDFAARYCLDKLAKCGPRKGRGRDRGLIFEVDNVKERQKQAGALTDAHRRAVSLWNLKKVLYCAIGETGEVRRPEFIRDNMCGCSKSTAYKLWDQACEELGLEFRDGAYRKKAKATTVQSDQPSPFIQPNQTSDFSVSVGHPAKTIDLIDSDPVIPSPAAGPPDPPRPKHVLSSADIRPAAVNCVLEPA